MYMVGQTESTTVIAGYNTSYKFAKTKIQKDQKYSNRNDEQKKKLSKPFKPVILLNSVDDETIQQQKNAASFKYSDTEFVESNASENAVSCSDDSESSSEESEEQFSNQLTQDLKPAKKQKCPNVNKKEQFSNQLIQYPNVNEKEQLEKKIQQLQAQLKASETEKERQQRENQKLEALLKESCKKTEASPGDSSDPEESEEDSDFDYDMEDNYYPLEQLSEEILQKLSSIEH